MCCGVSPCKPCLPGGPAIVCMEEKHVKNIYIYICAYSTFHARIEQRRAFGRGILTWCPWITEVDNFLLAKMGHSPMFLPAEPFEPGGPVEPVEPFEPGGPVEPVEPFKPVEPVEPFEPGGPVEPVEPFKPVEPVEPFGPGRPGGPGRPALGG